MARMLRGSGRSWATWLGRYHEPPELRRTWIEQGAEEYWRRRERDRHRRLRLVKLRHDLWAVAEQGKDTIRILRAALVSLIRAAAVGTTILAAVLLIEWALVRFAGWGLVPPGDSAPPIAGFPALAVQVLAAFLGFYLATVGIVLGNAYHEESASIRALVMDNHRTALYLTLLGGAIGGGLFLVLLHSFGLYSYGYLTLGGFAILVSFGGLAFFKLALGAFHLLNPNELAAEPLRTLHRTIVQLSHGGLLGDDAVLLARARAANGALRELAELFRLASSRPSVSRQEMGSVVERLFATVAFYSSVKHRLLPESRWFLREPAYPRWFESSDTVRSLALGTSTPLQVPRQPVPDWLEKKAAELTVAALRACLATNDTMAAIRIARAAGQTASALGRSYRIDEGAVFIDIIRDGCWRVDHTNDTSSAIAAEPPLMLTNLLLGWGEAVASWPSEVERAMDDTQWDHPGAAAVHIRGSDRVWREAQRLLKEIRVEHAVEGRRVSPDWFLRSALATECIFSLREFADELPELLRRFATDGPAVKTAPQAHAGAALQALEMLRKAEKLGDILDQAKVGLEGLQTPHESLPAPEIGALRANISSLRSPVLSRLANALTQLRPERSKSTPDYFGQALFTLWHHSEEAMARGDDDLIRRTFGQVLRASVLANAHLSSTNKPPTYQSSPYSLIPILNLIALSGLALQYESLRGDQSANPVREAWEEWLREVDAPVIRAKDMLDLLDSARSGFPVYDAARAEWQQRLSRHISDAGYAMPEARSSGVQSGWDAPDLIWMLGVSASLAGPTLDSTEVFAGEVLASWSEESDRDLRRRVALKRYYWARDALASAKPKAQNDDQSLVSRRE